MENTVKKHFVRNNIYIWNATNDIKNNNIKAEFRPKKA